MSGPAFWPNKAIAAAVASVGDFAFLISVNAFSSPSLASTPPFAILPRAMRNDPITRSVFTPSFSNFASSATVSSNENPS